MRPLAFLCVLLGAADASRSSPSPRFVLHGKRSQTPSQDLFKRITTLPDPATRVPLVFALKQRNIADLEQHLLRVSDPYSPDFGQHWDAKRVADTFSPAPQALRGVASWLRSAGVEPRRIRRSNDGTLVSVNLTLAEANSILKTEFSLFRRGDAADELHVGCDEYHVPQHLADHIDFVAPTIHLGVGTRVEHLRTSLPLTTPSHASPVRSHAKRLIVDEAPLDRQEWRSSKRRQVQAALPESCSRYTTLACLRAMYSIPVLNATHANNSFGIFEHAWVSWLPGDLDQFFREFSPGLLGSRPVMEHVNGGYWQDTVRGFAFNAESDLDFQYAMALTAPQPVINYQVGDMYAQGTMNTLLAAFDDRYCGALNATIDGAYPNLRPGGYNGSDCGTTAPANVISISYASHEVAFPEEYLRRQCQQYAKLGLQGVTVVSSSADCGVGGLTCECVDPVTGLGNGKTDRGAFGVTMPSGCPYVTSVGGTQWPRNQTGLTHEEAFWHVAGGDISSSGGGFSRVFEAPAYQKPAADKYLKDQRCALANITDRFNHRGRGVPDVAANAANYVVAINGTFYTVHGTSASAPVFASVVTLVNDARLRAGKGPVGFTNPVLYAHPEVMKDVVHGSNHGCGVNAFKAAKGWDPVTGLGTPDYEKLVNLYLSLP